MNDENKKRQPGRPSLPDDEKRSRNLTFRSRTDLRDRLSAAASKSGRSISEEVEFRLEESFATADKVALVKEGLENRIEDWQRRFAEARANHDAAAANAVEAIEKAKTELEGEYAENLRQLDEKFELMRVPAAVVDALIGGDVASRDAVRKIALLVADRPGWAESADTIENITQEAVAIIKAAAGKGPQQ